MSEWISVKDRLPDKELEEVKKQFPGEEDVEVIVVIAGAKVATALFYDGHGFRDEFFNGPDTNPYCVTHWMLLPEPPKEGETNEL